MLPQGRKRKDAIEQETNNYEDEAAPSMGCEPRTLPCPPGVLLSAAVADVQSNEERTKCLQKVFELGQDCPQVYRGVPQVAPADHIAWILAHSMHTAK